MIVERLDRTPADPFNSEDLATHARVDLTGDAIFDREIANLARAAALEAEEHGQLAVLFQTIRVSLDAWPSCAAFRLPIGPVLDAAPVTVTADGTPFEGFGVHTGLRPVIRLLGARPSGPVVITYQAGFGPDHASIPADLAQAIMDQASASFDARGARDPKAALSPHFARIIGRYRGVQL